MESEDISNNTKRRPITRSQTAAENKKPINVLWIKQTGQQLLLDNQSGESEDDDSRRSIDLDSDESIAIIGRSALGGTRSQQHQQVSFSYAVVIIV